MPCVYLPGPAPAVTVANNKYLQKLAEVLVECLQKLAEVLFSKVSGSVIAKLAEVSGLAISGQAKVKEISELAAAN